MAAVEFSEDSLNVRLVVKLSVVVTLGLYAGAITRKVVAENVAELIEAGGVESFIDDFEIDGLALDDGTELFDPIT